MRINDCIYVALYDIRQKKSFSIQMIKGLLLIISLLLFSLIIAFGIHSFYEETITDCGNLNYAVYIPDRNTNENVLSENDKKTIETIFSNVPLESIVDYAELDIPQMCGMGDKNLISMKSVSLETDGKRYYGIDSTEFRKNTLSVLAIESGYQVHSKYKLDFFKLHNPNKNAVIRGRMPEKAGEFVIDDIFMSQLGFSAESISDILGTQCTFCIDGKECINNLILCGVVDSGFINEEIYDNKAMLLFSADESMFDKLKIKNEFIRFYPQGFVHYELLKEIIQKNNWENTVFYDYTNAVNCQYISSLRIFANRLIILITIFVFTAMFLSLCGIIHEHIEKSSKYYGMLSAIGMKKSSELAIFYVEYSIILFFSIMLAVPIGIIMFCMTNLILSNTIGGSINVSIKSILALYIGIVLFLLIMIIIITTVNIIKKFSDTIVIQLKSL